MKTYLTFFANEIMKKRTNYLFSTNKQKKQRTVAK